MAKNIIFYFSGTGNCLAVAKQIAQQLGDCEVVFMKGEFTPAAHYERMGFVLPCYAGGAPKPAMEFLKKLPLNSGSADYVFSVITCNVNGGDASFMLNKALMQKGLRLNYAKTVRMVGNYVVQYSVPKNAEELLQNADAKLRKIAAEVKQKAETKRSRRHLYFTAFYGLGNQFFYLKEKQLRTSDACSGCGLCAQLCPVENIIIAGGKPQFLHQNCTNCLACLHWCPMAAIDCGKSTVWRERFHHPDVTAGELIAGREEINGQTA